MSETAYPLKGKRISVAGRKGMVGSAGKIARRSLSTGAKSF